MNRNRRKSVITKLQDDDFTDSQSQLPPTPRMDDAIHDYSAGTSSNQWNASKLNLTNALPLVVKKTGQEGFSEFILSRDIAYSGFAGEDNVLACAWALLEERMERQVERKRMNLNSIDETDEKDCDDEEGVLWELDMKEGVLSLLECDADVMPTIIEYCRSGEMLVPKGQVL